MRSKLLVMFTTLLFLSGCAGMSVPFKEERFARKMIQTSHDEKNTDCITLSDFKSVSEALEAQHVRFLASEDSSQALTKDAVEAGLGHDCRKRVKSLTTDEVRLALFGNLNDIPNADRLQLLGGILFEFEDTTTDSGVRPTFHIEQIQRGPERALVVVYTLEDGKVLHLNYSGTDNVDKRTLNWIVAKFFGDVAKSTAKAGVKGALVP